MKGPPNVWLELCLISTGWKCRQYIVSLLLLSAYTPTLMSISAAIDNYTIDILVVLKTISGREAQEHVRFHMSWIIKTIYEIYYNHTAGLVHMCRCIYFSLAKYCSYLSECLFQSGKMSLLISLLILLKYLSTKTITCTAVTELFNTEKIRH